MPEYLVAKAKKVKRGDGYDVTVTVRNTGTGTMPVEVAAAAGERWPKPARNDSKGSGAKPSSSGQSPSYREARETVRLTAGESKTLTIHCAFSPEKVVVDPDVRVLQLRRKQAVASL